MPRLVAIIVVTFMVALNTGKLCQALCIGKNSHSLSCKAMQSRGDDAKKDIICHLPKTSEAGHSCHGNKDGASLKCGCCSDVQASAGHEMVSVNIIYPAPDITFISKTHNPETRALEGNAVPQETPPKKTA